MIKKTFLSMAVASLVLFTSCKKNEEKHEEKAENAFERESKLFKKFGVQAQDQKEKRDPNAKNTVMTFEKTSHDFGNIKSGDKVTTEFAFTNTGKHDLTIYEAKGSCGCTVPEYPKTPIKPGEKGTIKVQFNSKGKTGEQKKSVFISTNTEKGNEVLEIKANISKK